MILDGNALVDFIKTGARAHYGKNSEKLVEFGVQPFRSRSRKAAAKHPAPETAKPSASTPERLSTRPEGLRTDPEWLSMHPE